MRNITCSVYQIKMSTSNTWIHNSWTPWRKLSILCSSRRWNTSSNKITKRHISLKVYILWIEYNPKEITTWYCKCKSGARILWYLGYALHNPDIRYGVKNWSKHLDDASDMPQVIDEIESDTNGSIVEEWLYWLVKHKRSFIHVLFYCLMLYWYWITSSHLLFKYLNFIIGYCSEHEIKM